jgi:hypothetical protein
MKKKETKKLNTKKLSLIAGAVLITAIIISGVMFVPAIFGGSPVVPTAKAGDGKAYIGGGSGIYYGAKKTSTTNCTLTTIGYDNDNNLVGIAAGHCADNAAKSDTTWSSVKSESAPDAGVIGTVVYKVFAGSGLGFFSKQPNWNDAKNKDYAVILFNKNKVVPQKTVGTFTINSIAAGSPTIGTYVCKMGRTTGNTCGIVARINSQQTFDSRPLWSSGGDSGSPVITSDGKLLGAVHGPVFIGFSYGTQALSINPIMDDINARGSIGAGFTPFQ